MLLLDYGVDIDTRHNITGIGKGEGLTALHVAAMDGDEEIFRLLIEREANADARDDNGVTAFYMAATEGNEAILKLLIENGTDVNVRCDCHEGTALHYAAFAGQVAAAQYLVREGIDFTAESWNGETALNWARKSRYEPMIMFLERIYS